MKAHKFLEKKNIEHTEVVQDKPTKSCDDAANQRGLETRQIVKSLIVRSEGENYHVLLPGDRTLSESKFGAEYRMVPPEESKDITGFESGTVHPFSTELKHVIDERIFKNDEVSHTVGEKQRGVILPSTNFRKALNKADFNFEIRDIAVTTEEDIEELEDRGLDKQKAKFVVNNGYRGTFLQLEEKYEKDNLITLLKEFSREETSPESELVEEILERAKNQTHIQRLVKSYAEKGELPEENDFDLEDAVSNVLDSNPEAVSDYENGQDSAVNYLIGQLMQRTNGRADAGEARQLLLEELP